MGFNYIKNGGNNMSSDRAWGVSAEVGALYRVVDIARVGHTWKPSVGDLAVCVGHSGDHFYDYKVIVPMGEDSYMFGKSFGAYSGCADKVRKLSKREYHLLMAGEIITREMQVELALGGTEIGSD
jgi:hypothetical protein